MIVAGVQLDIVWENKRANHDKVRDFVGAAKLPAGSLVVLPEMFATGFSMDVDQTAQSGEAETEAFLSTLAKERSLFVCGGVVTRGPDGRGLNQSVTFSPDGARLDRYAKIHPFSYGGETLKYSAGSEVHVYKVGGTPTASFVCYDLRFPEIFRNAARRGAELYTVIANWPEPREAHWLALLKARAIENQAYVIGVNRCGRDPKLSYSGRGQVIDPRGSILADGGNAEGVFRAEIDLEALRTYRKEFPALQDMKPGWL